MRWSAVLALIVMLAWACTSSPPDRVSSTSIRHGMSTSRSRTPAPSSPTTTIPSLASSPSPTSRPTPSTPVAPATVGSPGVRGRVSAGPTCPVEREDQPCPPNPVSDRRIDALSRGRVTGSAVTDAQGRYAIGLAPGDYTLHVANEDTFPRCPDTDVHVTAGSPVTADIDCDTGIR